MFSRVDPLKLKKLQSYSLSVPLRLPSCLELALTGK